MKWLKLDCDFIDDPKIQALADEFGGIEAAGFWTLVLAFVGRYGGPECRVRIADGTPFSWSFVKTKLKGKRKQVESKLKALANLSLINREAWENDSEIYIPNMLKRLDDYTRRVRTQSEGDPNNVQKMSALDLRYKNKDIRKKRDIPIGISPKESAPSAPNKPTAPDSEAPTETAPTAKTKPLRTERPRTPAPDTMPITDAMRGWANENGFDAVDLAAETPAMLDYHRGIGNLRADWIATWRTWIRNAARFKTQRPNGGISNGKTQPARRESYGDYVVRRNHETQALFDSDVPDATRHGAESGHSERARRALLPSPK